MSPLLAKCILERGKLEERVKVLEDALNLHWQIFKGNKAGPHYAVEAWAATEAALFRVAPVRPCPNPYISLLEDEIKKCDYAPLWSVLMRILSAAKALAAKESK